MIRAELLGEASAEHARLRAQEFNAGAGILVGLTTALGGLVLATKHEKKLLGISLTAAGLSFAVQMDATAQALRTRAGEVAWDGLLESRAFGLPRDWQLNELARGEHTVISRLALGTHRVIAGATARFGI